MICNLNLFKKIKNKFEFDPKKEESWKLNHSFSDLSFLTETKQLKGFCIDVSETLIGHYF